MRNIINLDRYPLDRPESAAYAALVADAQAQLATDGMFNLPGFLTAAALDTATAALTPTFAREAFTHARRHNIYFRKSIPDLPPDHPALREVETINRTLCADQMTGNPVLALYEWAPFAAFLAATMDKPALYTMDDPLARVNAMNYADGQGLNWHFDRSEFTTTLLLQAPRAAACSNTAQTCGPRPTPTTTAWRGCCGARTRRSRPSRSPPARSTSSAARTPPTA